MTPPTIEQYVRAQFDAHALYQSNDMANLHLLTADELRAVIVELERLRAEVKRMDETRTKGCDCAPDDACKFARQRDQWRECARELATTARSHQTLCPADEDITRVFQKATNDLRAALARFDSLVKEEKP